MKTVVFKISVIIPVYNTKQYLARCMESVLSQTLQEIEIILVDDGSTDGSGKLCDKYAGVNPGKVSVIHKQNGGLTSAWKAGSAVAKGKYIGYVDSDDYIALDMFEKLYESIEQEQADMSCCGLRHVYENKNHHEWTEQMLFPEAVFYVQSLPANIKTSLINDGSFMGRKLLPNRYTRIVKTEIVKKYMDQCADEVSIGEDYQFTLCMFLHSEKIVIIKDFFPYYYYMNDKSMTMQYDRNYLEKIKIMKENLLRVTAPYEDYQFPQQILNDFLCLVVLHIKGSIYKRKQLKYTDLRKDIREICEDEMVKKALTHYDMPKLTWAEKLFIYFMRKHMYFLIFLAVRLYFR